MTRQLRTKNAKTGLILANGSVLSYQHCIILSSQPRKSAYPDRNPLPEVITDKPVPVIEGKPEGEAVIEVLYSLSTLLNLLSLSCSIYSPFCAIVLLISGTRPTQSISTAITHLVSVT